MKTNAFQFLFQFCWGHSSGRYYFDQVGMAEDLTPIASHTILCLTHIIINQINSYKIRICLKSSWIKEENRSKFHSNQCELEWIFYIYCYWCMSNQFWRSEIKATVLIEGNSEVFKSKEKRSSMDHPNRDKTMHKLRFSLSVSCDIWKKTNKITTK